MKQHSNELKKLIYFELISWIGRNFLKKRSKIKFISEPLLLDLGAGSNFTHGWIHVDFFRVRNPIKTIFKHNSNRKNFNIVEADLRYPLLCPSIVVDGIYTSHTIEHLTYDDAYRLLKESFRVLKPKSWIRIIVPDLEIVINYYLGKNKTFDGFYKYNTGCEAIGSLTQNWGHKSVWDRFLLFRSLEEIGFTNIRKVNYKEGTDKRLIKEEECRRFESLVIEAQKP